MSVMLGVLTSSRQTLLKKVMEKKAKINFAVTIKGTPLIYFVYKNKESGVKWSKNIINIKDSAVGFQTLHEV